MRVAGGVRGVTVRLYEPCFAPDLHRLLLELHGNYFRENAAENIQELSREKDIYESYDTYINFIHEHLRDNWQVFVALSKGGDVVGFIIGSVAVDEYLANGIIGKIEDWFLLPAYRGAGAGNKLYTRLEQWFRQKKCDQVIADTWMGNLLSIAAHQSAGFSITSLSFGKKL